jgi:hypothetical protein
MAGSNDEPSIELYDNPLWWSLERIHQLLWQQLGNPKLAAADLTEVLATFVLSMRRSLASFCDRERLTFEFWDDHEVFWTGERLIVIRHLSDEVVELKGFVFFVWLPALAEVWPSIFKSLLPPPPLEDRPALQQSQSDAPTGHVVETESSTAAPAAAAKLFVAQHPRNSGERPAEYYDRLLELCGGKWTRKTLRTRYSEIRKDAQEARMGQHGPANGPK